MECPCSKTLTERFWLSRIQHFPTGTKSSASQIPGLTEWDILTRWGFIQGCQELLCNIRESFRETFRSRVIIPPYVRFRKGCYTCEGVFLMNNTGKRSAHSWEGSRD